MKRVQLTISLIIMIAFLVNCSDEQAKTDQPAIESHHSHEASETHQETVDGMMLNNGKKWEMDEHTRNSFNRMAESFLSKDPNAMEGAGLKQSAADLQNELDVLIKGCTMDGEAHNQLHIYLTGYIPAVQALSESGSLTDAQKVRHYLEIYDDYLE